MNRLADIEINRNVASGFGHGVVHLDYAAGVEMWVPVATDFSARTLSYATATRRQGQHYQETGQLQGRFHAEASNGALLAIFGGKKAAEMAMAKSRGYARSSRALEHALARWQAVA